MGNIPKVGITFSNENLLQNIVAIDGNAALIGTGSLPANLDKVFTITSLPDAVSQGITQVDEPMAYKHIAEFYNELGGNQTIYVLLCAETVTMADMLLSTSSVYANKLIAAGEGKISIVGVFRKPPVAYNAGADFIDTDVTAALTNAKTFVQALNNSLNFTRILIEGRIATEASNTILNVAIQGNDFAGVVLGDTVPGKGAAIGLALGRKMKYPCHIKIGKTANGPLSAASLYIGSKKLGVLNSLIIPPVIEVKPTGTVTITNIGALNDIIECSFLEPNGSYPQIFFFQRTAAETTPALLATAIKDNINTKTVFTGYTATSAGAVITIIGRPGAGASLNGLVLAPYVTGTIAYTTTNFVNGVNGKPLQSTQLEKYHEAGFISFVTYPGKGGFFFGIDNMANKTDYRLLVYGCVIDAAAKIAASVFIDELEGEVDTNEDGTIKDIDATHLEDRVKQQAEVTLGDRISGFEALVDRTVNIINTGLTKVKLRVRPKGYLTFIEVDLGLSAGN